MRILVCALSLFLSFLVYAIDVHVAEAPDNNLKFTLSALKSAKKSLLLNMYEFTSPEIGAAVVDRVNAGVHVEILQEGQVVGGLSVAAKKVQSEILEAMKVKAKGNRLFMMTSKAGGRRRFVVDHAKYAVIDGTRLLIGSENYSPNGHPVKARKGNRGWEVVVVDKPTVNKFIQIFEKDKDTSFKDVIELTPASSDTVERNTGLPVINQIEAEGIKPAPVPDAMYAERVSPIFSPETSLSGLETVMREAKQSLDIQQMTFAEKWGQTGKRSLLVENVLAAARRGIRIRVLINDDTVFSNGTAPSKNALTKDTLNLAAKNEGLELEARIANLKRMGVAIIHNKGLLADDDKTLISSINWNQNSVENNREAAILIESKAVHAHYAALFEKDWKASE